MESNKKALAIISFSVVMTALLVAIISDFVIFAEAIITFVAGTIIAVVAFIFFIILMIASCILIFGIYILQNYGFWPATLSMDFYKEMLADIKVSQEALNAFRAFRIAFLVICTITFIIAIIALHKDEMIEKKVPLKGMSVVALIFSILGIVTAIGVLVITSLIG